LDIYGLVWLGFLIAVQKCYRYNTTFTSDPFVFNSIVRFAWPNPASIQPRFHLHVYSRARRWRIEATRLLQRDDNEAGEMARRGGERRVQRDRVVAADCRDLPRTWQPCCVRFTYVFAYTTTYELRSNMKSVVAVEFTSFFGDK